MQKAKSSLFCWWIAKPPQHYKNKRWRSKKKSKGNDSYDAESYRGEDDPVNGCRYVPKLEKKGE